MALPEHFRHAYGARLIKASLWITALSAASFCAFAQGPQNVLLVVNDKSAVSRTIGEYYARKRSIPQSNICHIRTSVEEDIARADYDQSVAAPIRQCLEKNRL